MQPTMRECMEINKALVSILLAVYKPNTKWFIEQLISLNNQTYNNIELLVYDDCPDFPIDEALIKKYITNFPYNLTRGIKNEGSNKAFEYLTSKANGDFFAYCDQDDMWESNKIELMIEKFSYIDESTENMEKLNEECVNYNKDVTLVCSDLSIIDENSKKLADSITEIRKRHKFKSGYNLAKDLLVANFVIGCAMMVRSDVAKKAIPFENTLVHDMWIAIIAATEGKIVFINKPLVRYRQHSFNQTGILTDIYDKETYYNIRIEAFFKRYIALRKRLSYNSDLSQSINDCLTWLEARKNYSTKISFKDLRIMIKYRNFHRISILVEAFLPFIPSNIFKYIIKLTKKGML